MNDLKIILDRTRKPLTFATRDNFAHLQKRENSADRGC